MPVDAPFWGGRRAAPSQILISSPLRAGRLQPDGCGSHTPPCRPRSTPALRAGRLLPSGSPRGGAPVWLFQGAGPGAPQPSPSSQLPGLRPAGVHSALCRAGRIGPLQSFSVAGFGEGGQGPGFRPRSTLLSLSGGARDGSWPRGRALLKPSLGVTTCLCHPSTLPAAGRAQAQLPGPPPPPGPGFPRVPGAAALLSRL